MYQIIDTFFDYFVSPIHQFGVFGGQVGVWAGLSTEMAFLVDREIVIMRKSFAVLLFFGN